MAALRTIDGIRGGDFLGGDRSGYRVAEHDLEAFIRARGNLPPAE